MLLYKSTGIIKYSQSWAVVEVCRDLSEYYRKFIPLAWRHNRQMYAPHITLVRKGHDEYPNMDFWGKYEGEEVEFSYEPKIHWGQVYYWLNVWSVRLEEIRRELGLPVETIYTVPPPGFTKTFHITLGNKKGFESWYGVSTLPDPEP